MSSAKNGSTLSLPQDIGIGAAGRYGGAFPRPSLADRLRSSTAEWEVQMPAYFVAELEITNMEAMGPYREAVPATIAQHGGRFLTRGGAAELIEGGPEPKRIVILEFADAAAIKRWYNSPEYQKILPQRLNNSRGRAFIVEGAS
jgi:uncharacterized protein (DUF1330 family)